MIKKPWLFIIIIYKVPYNLVELYVAMLSVIIREEINFIILSIMRSLISLNIHIIY